MPHFDAIESMLSEPGQSLARPLATGMRPYCECACRMREPDCVGNIQARFGNVGGFASTKQTVERVAIIHRVPITNQHSRDVRPTKCATRCLGDDIVEADWSTVACQLIDNAPPAFGSLALESFETRPYCACVTDVEREKMNFEVAIVGTKFTATNNADAETCTSCNRLIVSGNRIVIGNRNGLQLRTLGSLDELDWRNRTIRSSRVGMQIYITLAGWFPTAINHRA